MLGLIILLVGAGGVVGQLQTSLNTIWGVTALFAMIYKILPDVNIEWRDVWIGAALTSFLFSIGKIIIGMYLGSTGVTSPYGAAGSLITILLWVYYSSLIFFLGAEFTQLHASQYGSGVTPTENAEPLGVNRKRETPPPETRSGERMGSDIEKDHSNVHGAKYLRG